MIRIFIEGKEIDVTDDITMDLNYAIADITELDKRNTQFSKTIVIPNSIFNREVFGYFYDIDIQNPYNDGLPNVGINFNATKKAKAVIYKDNIAVFKGICRMISVVQIDGDIRYEINLFGRLKDILLELGETYIHELDWDGDSDQVNFPDQVWQYNPANFKKLYNNTTGSGQNTPDPINMEFCMPMVDYGSTVNMSEWKWIDFKPAVYVRDVMKRMFRFAKFVWKFDFFAPFFNTEYFKKLVIINGEQGVGQWLKDIIKFNLVQEYWTNECPQYTQLQNIYLSNGTPNTPLNVNNPIYYFNATPNWTQEYNLGALFNYNTTESLTNNIGLSNYNCGDVKRRFWEYTGLVSQSVNINIVFSARVFYRVLNTQILNNNDYNTLNTNIFHTLSIVRTNSANVVQEVLWGGVQKNLNTADGAMNMNQAPINNIAVAPYWQYNVNLNTSKVLNPGDRIQIICQGRSAYSPFNFFNAPCGFLCVQQRGYYMIDWSWLNAPGYVKLDLPTISFVPISLNSTAYLKDQLPRNIKCVDLFKTIILMHNLYVEQDDNQENLLHITPHPLYYDYDITKAADWTDKIALDKEIRLIPLSELKARTYKFTYESDNDYWSESYKKRFNQEYGEKVELIDNDFLDTTEEIKSIFSPCVVASVDPSNRVYVSLYKLDGTTKKPDKFKPRIALYKKLNTSQYFVMDNTTPIYNSTNDFGGQYNYAGHFDDPTNASIDVNFNVPQEIYFTAPIVATNNLYETFWKRLLAEISDKDSRLLVAYFDLKGYDVENIDFARLIKVRNQYFKLIKIENFNPEGDTLSKVSLLKVLYDTNFGELSYILQEDNPFILQENGTNKFYI